MTFNPQTGAVGISIQWHFKCHMLELSFTSTISSQTPFNKDWNELPASIISSAESSDMALSLDSHHL